MRTPDGQECWNAVEYHEIVPQEKIVSSMYFSDSQGNKVEPAELGIEHEAIDGAYDVTIFEDLGNGQTKLTFIGNEPMESAKNSGQLEGWKQILDKVAAVVDEASAGEIRSCSFDDCHGRDLNDGWPTQRGFRCVGTRGFLSSLCYAIHRKESPLKPKPGLNGPPAFIYPNAEQAGEN